MKDLGRFVRLLHRYLRPHWRAMAILVAASYIGMVLSALLPVLIAPILDLALGAPPAAAPAGIAGVDLRNLGTTVLKVFGLDAAHGRFAAIALLCVVYVVVGLTKGLVDFANLLLALWIRVRVSAGMQLDLFRHLLSLSLGFFHRRRTGELLARLDNDTRAASQGLETVVGTFFTAPIFIAVYGFLLVRTSPTLAAAAVGAAALHWSLTRLIRGPIRRRLNEQFSVFGDLVSRIQESILSIRVVKSFGAEAFELERLRQAAARVVAVNVRFGAFKHAEEPARTAVNYVIEASIILIAAWELLAGHLSAPTFFLFLYVGRAVMTQIAQLGSAWSLMHQNLAAANRVADVLTARIDLRDGDADVTDFQHRIALEGVSFDYGEGAVLDDVTLAIEKGEVVAIVGPSGAGKSTLADLILRLYDPRLGRVTIDGCDVRTLRQAAYRSLFGVVSQEPLLFNATIYDNIVYGRAGLTEADVVRAAEIANAHDFVTELAHGYETVVGDRGVRLSGGQRQRVAIARAIVHRPQILILDEATSSLDSEAERLVQDAIDRVIRGCTSIVIAHRFSTVSHADKIVVLNRGRVEAIGRHQDLLGRSETYSRLYQFQVVESSSARL
jgi:ATP-binding cassette, subfamily B, bacterial MsbA